jgi:hypothetical protein
VASSRSILTSAMESLKGFFQDPYLGALLVEGGVDYDPAYSQQVATEIAQSGATVAVPTSAVGTGKIYTITPIGAKFYADYGTTGVFELYRQEPSVIEGRKDIPRYRMALYENAETVTDRTGNFRPNLSLQNYGIDISVVRGYHGDHADEAELVLLDLCDAVKEWVKIVEIGTITDLNILTFNYINSSGITRNEIYVTRTLNFSALRDLTQTQIQ